MTWRWRSRQDERARHEEWLAALNDVRGDVSQLREKLDGIMEYLSKLDHISEHVNKLGRLQHRIGQEQSAKLGDIDVALTELLQHEISQDEQSRRLQLVEGHADRLVAAMLRWLDDLDELSRKLDEDGHSSWGPLFTQWRDQVLRELAAVEVRELSVIGRSFDPRFCEGAQSVVVEPSEGRVPYEVLQVLRRGFVSDAGEIIRKALVVTARERSSDDES